MVTKAQLDPRKSGLRSTVDHKAGFTALQFAAMKRNDPAVLEFFFASYPLALIAPLAPLLIATACNRPEPIIALLAATSNALASRDFATLAARVHTDSSSINLAILGPARLLTRVSILICLKRLTLERFARERLSLGNLSLDGLSLSRQSRSSTVPAPRSLATYGPSSSRSFS